MCCSPVLETNHLKLDWLVPETDCTSKRVITAVPSCHLEFFLARYSEQAGPREIYPTRSCADLFGRWVVCFIFVLLACLASYPRVPTCSMPKPCAWWHCLPPYVDIAKKVLENFQKTKKFLMSVLKCPPPLRGGCDIPTGSGHGSSVIIGCRNWHAMLTAIPKACCCCYELPVLSVLLMLMLLLLWATETLLSMLLLTMLPLLNDIVAVEGGGGDGAHAGGRGQPARHALCAEGGRGERDRPWRSLWSSGQ